MPRSYRKTTATLQGAARDSGRRWACPSPGRPWFHGVNVSSDSPSCVKDTQLFYMSVRPQLSGKKLR